MPRGAGTINMRSAYDEWNKLRTPEADAAALSKIGPQLDKAVRLYVGAPDTAARSHAKLLALKAFESYDPKKGTHIQTHFYNQLQPLRRFAAKRRFPVSIPETVQQDLAGLDTARSELEDKLDREPSLAELADYTGLSTRRLSRLSQYGFAVPESTREYAEESQTVDTDSSMSDWEDYIYYDLSPTDKKIYEWRTGYGGAKKLSNNEIAKRLKLSAGAVSQRVSKIADRFDRILDGRR